MGGTVARDVSANLEKVPSHTQLALGKHFLDDSSTISVVWARVPCADGSDQTLDVIWARYGTAGNQFAWPTRW